MIGLWNGMSNHFYEALKKIYKGIINGDPLLFTKDANEFITSPIRKYILLTKAEHQKFPYHCESAPPLLHIRGFLETPEDF